MADRVELAIVGAGPAGLGAALAAAELGVQTMQVDAYPLPGGQYCRQVPAEFEQPADPGDEGQALVHALSQSGTRVLAETAVWGIFVDEDGPGYLLCLYGPAGTPRRVHADKVILAPGAYDRPVAFPGWTLPGVMTAGAAQLLIKGQRVLPGQHVLLAGTGPLQWALASQLIDGGAEVVGILDANPFPANSWRHLGAIWGQWGRLHEGWQYWRTIRTAGVRLRWDYTVFGAQGGEHLERAVIGRRGGRERETLSIDTLCLGYGFVPATQLPLQAGCEHIYEPKWGSYVPRRDEWLQTTLPGLFVAGDGAGIGGKEVALLEGQLAAMAAATQLGRGPSPAQVKAAQRALSRQRRFATALDALFPFPPDLWDLITDDTIVCRCEEVTAGEVRRAVASGATTPNAAKALTRAGMGLCQGRNCCGAVAHLIARETGRRVDSVGWFTPRPPVVPVPLEGLPPEEEGPA